MYEVSQLGSLKRYWQVGISGKLKDYVFFHFELSLEGSPDQSVWFKEGEIWKKALLNQHCWEMLRLEIELDVMLECVSKFCYLGDTHGAGEGAKKAAMFGVRFARAKLNELSPNLYSLLGIQSAIVADWDCLDILSKIVKMIGCWLAGIWRCWGEVQD